jgi:hypothetical protein
MKYWGTSAHAPLCRHLVRVFHLSIRPPQSPEVSYTHHFSRLGWGGSTQVKLSLIYHYDIKAWGIGYREPHFLNLSTSFSGMVSLTLRPRDPGIHYLGGCMGTRASRDATENWKSGFTWNVMFRFEEFCWNVSRKLNVRAEFSRRWLWIMLYTGMRHRVAFVRNDVSEERIVCIIGVERMRARTIVSINQRLKPNDKWVDTLLRNTKKKRHSP